MRYSISSSVFRIIVVCVLGCVRVCEGEGECVCECEGGGVCV